MPSCLPATSIHQRIKPFTFPAVRVSSRTTLLVHSLPFSFFACNPIRPQPPRVRVSGTSCLFYSSSTLRLAFCTSLKGRRIAADRCYGGGAWKERRKRRIRPFYPVFFIFSLPQPLSLRPRRAAANARISTHCANLIRELLQSGRRFLLGNSALFMSDCERSRYLGGLRALQAGLASPVVDRGRFRCARVSFSARTSGHATGYRGNEIRPVKEDVRSGLLFAIRHGKILRS